MEYDFLFRIFGEWFHARQADEKQSSTQILMKVDTSQTISQETGDVNRIWLYLRLFFFFFRFCFKSHENFYVITRFVFLPFSAVSAYCQSGQAVPFLQAGQSETLIKTYLSDDSFLIYSDITENVF